MTRDDLIILYRQQGMSWPLLLAQGFVESRLDPQAVSGAGCQGIAQFAPATWQECVARGWAPDGSSPFDPLLAIPAQARYMTWLQARFPSKSIRQALASYNWGLGNVQRMLRIHGEQWEAKIPVETICYIRQVQTLAEWIGEQKLEVV